MQPIRSQRLASSSTSWLAQSVRHCTLSDPVQLITPHSVWTVRREPLEGDWDPSADAPPVRITLGRYTLPFWPEALLVVRA